MHAVTLLLAILLPTSSAAQEYSTTPLERTAVRTAILATAIPLVAGTALIATSGDDGPPILLAEVGLVFGPTMGYEAAEMGGRGWRGAGLRAGLALASFIGALAVCWDCSEDEEQTAWMVLIGGHLLVATSAMYDIARLPHNIQRHEAQRRVGIAPFYAPGEQRVGLRGQIGF
jgi:hypothetical protein